MSGDAAPPMLHLLDPIGRIAEILFGLTMVLTTTATLGVVTAERAQIRARWS